MRPWFMTLFACAGAAVGVAACGDDTGPSACGTEVVEYDCAASTLTYRNTVEPLATQYCTACHASEKTTPAARRNAPEAYDYDSEDGWLESGAHALGEIQCGRMPKVGGPIPEEMVSKLDEWVTCQGLKEEHNHADHEH